MALATPAFAQGQATGEVEEVVVTGFRASLNNALAEKRAEAAAVDVIKAEDIADFPDANLAESLQRVPGVSISRVAGEGRAITVRGLSSSFTRVRVNGMEAQSTSGATTSDRGSNTGRGFDFNTFSSELFNSLSVRKTASADVIEGSLGATVDLQTARPFDYKDFTFVANAQVGYNDLGKKWDPKLAFVVSNRWDTGIGEFGALLSVAYSKRRYLEDQFGSGGWNPATVDGGFCTPVGRTPQNPASNPATGTDALNCAAGVPRPPANDQLYDLGNRSVVFFPRLPRYGRFAHDQERLGGSLALQWRPTERTQLNFDALVSDYDVMREESWLEGFSFARAISQFGKPQTAIRELILREAGKSRTQGVNFDQTVYDVDFGRFEGVDVRSDTQHDEFRNVFQQYTLSGTHELNDRLRVSGLVGYSKSRYDQPYTTTIMFQRPNAGMTVDFRRNRDQPIITHDFDVNDPSMYVFGTNNAEVRLQSQWITNIYRTAEANLEWDYNDSLKFKAGGHFDYFSFDTYQLQRPNSFLVPNMTSQELASVTRQVQGFGDGLDVGVFPSRWLTIDYDKFVEKYGIYSNSGMFNMVRNNGGTRRVEEKVASAYVQADFDTTLLGVPMRGDIGVRYARTNLYSIGYQVGATPQQVEAEHHYDDILPSLNTVFEVRPDMLVRFSAARVVSRPELGFLTPGGSLNLTGTPSITSGNPELKPIRANTVDVAWEWYFAPGSLLSVAGFYKDIKTYVQNQSQQMSFRQTGLPLELLGTSNLDPDNSVFTVTRPLNTPGGPLKGFEVNYQQSFSFLPGLLANTGALFNYTYVQSEITYYLAASATTTTRQDLIGLSKNAYNATVYYEDEKLSARLSAAYRDEFIIALPANNPLQDYEGYSPNLTFDFAASYQVNDNVKLTFEALNIFDRFNRQFIDSTRDSTFVYTHTGRQVYFGVQYKF